MTHVDRIRKQYTVGPDRPNVQPWRRKHEAAMELTRPIKGRKPYPIAKMVWALAEYADEHDGLLAEDSVLGPPWKEWVDSLFTLLNSDLGDLDGGTLDKALRTMLKEEGFDEE